MKSNNYCSKYNTPVSDEIQEMLEKLESINDWIIKKYDNKKYATTSN